MSKRLLLRVVALLLAPTMSLVACNAETGPEGDTGTSTGTGTGTGTATDSTDGSATDADGGYQYASNVDAHRLVVEDICAINDLLNADEIDFDAIAELYEEGQNSVSSDGSVRSIGGFASSEDRNHGLRDYYGIPTPLDDFVDAALEGTGPFEGESAPVRRQGVQKGIQNQVMVAWMVHELNSALDKAADEEFDPAEGAPHNWDEAWAFYFGADRDCAPYATGEKRGDDFGTNNAEQTALANAAILEAMNDGRDALLEEDAEGAQAAADEVKRNLAIIYSQAAVKYATVAAEDVEERDEEAARVHQAEGYAFFRVVENQLAEAGADVEAVNAILHLSNEPAAAGGGDEVRTALAPAWEELDISDEDIGALQ